MRVEIRARHFTLTEALREHVEKRLNSAVDTRKASIADVTVHLSDENGPKGGEDKHAHVTATVLGKTVVIEERDENMYAAIDRAMDRLQQTIARTIDRKREFTA
jgi:putative sigma-54 modulation protein